MEKTRPGRPSPEANRFECSLTSEMVKRAIYIDFEGFWGQAPSLIGVAIGAKFYQVALDEGLRLAAGAKKIPVRSGDELVRDLLERAVTRETPHRRLFVVREADLQGLLSAGSRARLRGRQPGRQEHGRPKPIPSSSAAPRA